MLGGGASKETCNGIADVLNAVMSTELFQKDGSAATLLSCRSFGPYTLLAPNTAGGFDCPTVAGAMNTMIADYLANDRCPAVTTTPTSTATSTASSTPTTTTTESTTTVSSTTVSSTTTTVTSTTNTTTTESTTTTTTATSTTTTVSTTTTTTTTASTTTI